MSSSDGDANVQRAPFTTRDWLASELDRLLVEATGGNERFPLPRISRFIDALDAYLDARSRTSMSVAAADGRTNAPVSALAAVGWPLCLQCMKPVDELHTEYPKSTGTKPYSARCHGEACALYLSIFDLPEAHGKPFNVIVFHCLVFTPEDTTDEYGNRVAAQPRLRVVPSDVAPPWPLSTVLPAAPMPRLNLDRAEITLDLEPKE